MRWQLLSQGHYRVDNAYGLGVKETRAAIESQDHWPCRPLRHGRQAGVERRGLPMSKRAMAAVENDPRSPSKCINDMGSVGIESQKLIGNPGWIDAEVPSSDGLAIPPLIGGSV